MVGLIPLAPVTRRVDVKPPPLDLLPEVCPSDRRRVVHLVTPVRRFAVASRDEPQSRDEPARVCVQNVENQSVSRGEG